MHIGYIPRVSLRDLCNVRVSPMLSRLVRDTPLATGDWIKMIESRVESIAPLIDKLSLTPLRSMSYCERGLAGGTDRDLQYCPSQVIDKTDRKTGLDTYGLFLWKGLILGGRSVPSTERPTLVWGLTRHNQLLTGEIEFDIIRSIYRVIRITLETHSVVELVARSRDWDLQPEEIWYGLARLIDRQEELIRSRLEKICGVRDVMLTESAAYEALLQKNRSSR